MDWTPENIKMLRRLAKKYTAKEIGHKLGRTRNSIIGKCNRLGIKLEGTKMQNEVAKLDPVAVMRMKLDVKPVRPKTQFKLFTFSPSVARISKPISFASRVEGQCGYIIGDPKELTCCGNGTNRYYCDEHHELCYVKKSPRQESPGVSVEVSISPSRR